MKCSNMGIDYNYINQGIKETEENKPIKEQIESLNKLFCVYNLILQGFSNEDLLDMILSNEKTIDKQIIEKCFKELLQMQLAEAKEIFQSNKEDILKLALKIRETNENIRQKVFG